MAEPLTQRNHSFVSRVIQGSLLWRLARYWLVYTLLLWHALFLWHVIDSGLSLARPDGLAQDLWGLYTEFCRQHVRLAICAVAIFPLFFWDALRLTHRIAGPLKRFRDALEWLSRGEAVSPLTLRRDDLLVEYQHAFNRYLRHLEQDRPSRSSLSSSSPTESDVALPSADDPLLQDVETMRAEIQQAASDSTADF